MDNFLDKRYLSNLIGLFFVCVSLIGLLFIEEKLTRQEKDHEPVIHHHHHIVSSTNNTTSTLKENEEHLLKRKNIFPMDD